MTPEDRRALFAMHHAELRRFVRRLVPSVDDADDLLQDIAVVLLGHHSGPDDADFFCPWCRGVARHLAAHRRRAFARRETSLAALAALGELSGDPAFADPERLALARQHMMANLDALDESARKLFFARFIAGETPAELAARCMVSPASMRMRLMRLRYALRERVAPAESSDS